jgi:hypothetical protein
MSHQKKVSDNENLLLAIQHKSYFDLSGKQKMQFNELVKEKKIKTLTFSINPNFLLKLQPNIHQYIMFIDARRADYYFKVKEYIEGKKEYVNAFFTTGDADYIVHYSTTEAIHNTIKKEILEILNKIIQVDDTEELIQCFRVSKQMMIKGKPSSSNIPDTDELTFDDRSKVAHLLNNYHSEKNTKRLGSPLLLKKFLKELERKDILENYYAITTINSKIKAVVLILYTAPGFDNIFRTDREIAKNIIDLYEVKGDNLTDPWFQRANYAIFASFNSMNEYHSWKERVYTESLQISQTINFMTYVVEDTISEIPQSIGNLREFEELIIMYNKSPKAEKILMGKPFYYDEVEENQEVSLNAEFLKDQGMFIGYMGSGKTYTAVEFAKRLTKQGINVHFIDTTNGILKKIDEDFSELKGTDSLVQIEVNGKEDVNLFNGGGKIYIYNVKGEEYPDFVASICTKIEGYGGSPGRKTTDVIIFEEAHILFSDPKATKKIFKTIKFAGRNGCSLWFSTQKLADFPIDGTNTNLASLLKNRVVQKIEPSEAESIAHFLSENDKAILYTTRESLRKLNKGEALVSLYNDEKQLKPIRIKFSKS